MKILFLTRRFYPNIGGVEKHVLELSKELIGLGHNITIITEKIKSDKVDKMPFKDQKGNIQIIRINAGKDDWFKKFRIWKELWKKRYIIKEADIVHCHDVFFWYLPFRFLHPIKNAFITFHGYETEFPINRKAIFVRKLSEFLANGNIIIGDYIKKWYGTNPNFISYGGVDDGKLSQSPVNKKTYVNIIFIGRLEQDLGLKSYMNALEKLKSEKYKYTFSAYGEGSYKNKLGKFGKIYGYSENVHKVIGNADIVFCSSYLLMLEALINRKIVIAVYENPVKEDYLRMSPFSNFIYVCKNSEEIVNVMDYIKRDPWKSKTMIDKGYKWARQQTWENVAKQYLNLWKV